MARYVLDAAVREALAWFRSVPDRVDDIHLYGGSAVAMAQARLIVRAALACHDASADAPRLSEQDRETGQCSQCGKGFAELACGPTHAVAAAVWFGGEKQAQAAEALRRERDELLARSDEWRAAAVVMTRVATQRTLAGDELAAAVREWIRPDANVSDVQRVERAVKAWTVIREAS